MPSHFYDRVKETTTTTGTGNITLAGAVTQFRSFSSAFTTGANAFAAEVFYYAIVGQSGSEWEVGKGYITSATNMVRLQVFASSNSNNAVNFSAGTKDVFCTIPAERMDEMYTKGQSVATATGQQWA